MEILNATAAKREFGDLILKAQSEPISISKNGKPVAVILSDREYHQLEAFKAHLLKIAIEEGIEDINQDNIYTHNNVFDHIKSKFK